MHIHSFSAVNADDDLDEEDLSYLASRSRAKPQKATTSDKPSNERPYKSSRSPERDSRYASSSYRVSHVFVVYFSQSFQE